MIDAHGRVIERKVITALFCDLVGSTELAERLDPEDVDLILLKYFRLARRRIETNGGSLEKFIGDAVVGLFGATEIHEDDPTRAVRAALAMIREIHAANLGIEVRIGIQTGEAVINVDEQRSAEEGVATGDILNTAARLQNAAPAGGIAVGDATYRRTKSEFEWHDLGEVTLKGKAQPVQIWQPLTEVEHTAWSPSQEATPFLGRQAELSSLLGAFDRAVEETTIQLATVVAEPGMGKSRLVRELAREVLRRPNVKWLSGRCLPYGDGISFWALGEIVKAEAGILETDDQQTIAAKLDDAILERDPQIRAWLTSRLAPLVGMQTHAAPAEQDELFSAWNQFLASLARQGPTVVVFEDLHWADNALIEFLTQLSSLRQRLALMIIVTARPQVAERHPAWLEHASQHNLMQLTSLDDDDVRTLVEAAHAGASRAFIATVLERAAGSPLYAEQFAALARERGLSTGETDIDESTIPPTIQALLAARVDSLPRELKPVLLDASVIGRVFWSGAIASLEGTDRSDADPALQDLARRELTRAEFPSAMVDDAQYAFWHALLRDVAYSFLPRAARLAKHRAAATWITERAGDHLADLAEIVADHLRRAFELATATGADDDLPAIRSALVDTLIAAADHTMRVEPSRTTGQLNQALDLMDADDGRRPQALNALGKAHMARFENQAAAQALEAAAQWHLDHGDELAAAELAPNRSRVLQNSGHAREAESVLAQAEPILRANPGPALIDFLAIDAFRLMNHGYLDEASALAESALRLAEELGLPRPHRVLMADPRADTDAAMREVVDLAMAAGDNRTALLAMSARGQILEETNVELGIAAYDEAIAFARRYGLGEGPTRARRLDSLETAGRWDEALDEAAALKADAIEHGDEYAVFMIAMHIGGIEASRGTGTEPMRDPGPFAAAVGLPPYLGGGVAALSALNLGDPAAARAMVETTVARVPEGRWIAGAVHLVHVALAVRDEELAEAVLAKAFPDDDATARGLLTRLATGLVLEAQGKFSEAIRKFAEADAFLDEHGFVVDRLFALFGLGRCRVASGDMAGGLEALRGARDIAVYLKAEPMLREIDGAIAAASGVDR